MAETRQGWGGRNEGRHLAVLRRRQYVFQLRCTGATYDAIFQATRRQFGAELPPGYKRSDVHRDVMTELRKRRAELEETVEQVRALELARLDQQLLAYWQRSLGTPANLERGILAEPPDIEASQQVLRIMQQRLRLLPGLAAPIPVASTTPDGTKPYDPQEHVTEAFCIEVADLLAQFGQSHVNGHTATPTTD